MINKDSDIEIIISKYLSKEAIPEEIKVLDDWISAAPENYRSFLSQKNVWEVSHPAFNPVSYTHLDVYKRQLQYTSGRDIPTVLIATCSGTDPIGPCCCKRHIAGHHK